MAAGALSRLAKSLPGGRGRRSVRLRLVIRFDWRGWIERQFSEGDLWASYGWLGTTSAAMILCWLFAIPNAGAFLLLAIAHAVLTGGWKTGVASATLSTIYTAIYLSSPEQMFHYADGGRALSGIVIACYGMVFVVTYMQRRQAGSLRREAEEIKAQNITGESERLYRDMADAAPMLLWLTEQDGRRTFFNRRWLELTGKTLDELTGPAWPASVHPDDLSAWMYRFQTAVRNCERFECEYRLRAADNQFRWMQDVALPRIGADGEYLGFVGSSIDTTERRRVEKALHQLSGRLLELQDDERRRIARELHDTTAQNLAVLSMNLSVVKDASRILGQKPRQAVADSLDLAEQCSREVRTLSYLLHPPLLDELGLVSALRSYSTGFTQRTGIQIELKIEEIGRLPGEIETTLFRIVQEALTNVHRHSGSPRAEVRIIRDPKEVMLQVADEGRGVAPGVLDVISEGASIGVGVAGMRERAGQLGGHLKIGSGTRGTTITAILPLRGRD
jgi:PAS domain S-box-containing protein